MKHTLVGNFKGSNSSTQLQYDVLKNITSMQSDDSSMYMYVIYETIHLCISYS